MLVALRSDPFLGTTPGSQMNQRRLQVWTAPTMGLHSSLGTFSAPQMCTVAWGLAHVSPAHPPYAPPPGQHPLPPGRSPTRQEPHQGGAPPGRSPTREEPHQGGVPPRRSPTGWEPHQGGAPQGGAPQGGSPTGRSPTREEPHREEPHWAGEQAHSRPFSHPPPSRWAGWTPCGCSQALDI